MQHRCNHESNLVTSRTTGKTYLFVTGRLLWNQVHFTRTTITRIPRWKDISRSDFSKIIRGEVWYTCRRRIDDLPGDGFEEFRKLERVVHRGALMYEQRVEAGPGRWCFVTSGDTFFPPDVRNWRLKKVESSYVSMGNFPRIMLFSAPYSFPFSRRRCPGKVV